MNAPTTLTISMADTPFADKDLSVVPLLRLDTDQVQFYFQSLYVNDTLKYRFADIVDPKWDDVKRCITRVGQQMFMVVREGKIVGEYMLENLAGRAIQGHFSTAPHLTFRQRIAVGRFVLRSLLNFEPNGEGYMFDAVYGLTPLVNRVACLYALKIGFKKQGILPNGTKYLGGYEDCMISVATRESL